MPSGGIGATYCWYRTVGHLHTVPSAHGLQSQRTCNNNEGPSRRPMNNLMALINASQWLDEFFDVESLELSESLAVNESTAPQDAGMEHDEEPC